MYTISEIFKKDLGTSSGWFLTEHPINKNMISLNPEIDVLICGRLLYRSGVIDQVLLHGKLHGATDKVASALIFFEPRIVLALLSILSWLQSFSFRPHCNSRFLLIKELLSHNVTSGHEICAVLHGLFFFCPLRQKNWKNVDHSLKRTAQLW